MVPLTLTFDIPAKILMGLADGSFTRSGGVVQDTSGRVVMWLRELGGAGLVSSPNSLMSPRINPVTGVLNLAIPSMNTGTSMKSFGAVTQQLNLIQGMLSITTAASILNLGISAIGFAFILKKLRAVEERLEKIQVSLNKIDSKVDLSFYANFRAALDLATNAFTMKKGENRTCSAHNAINRFLEAEHIYAGLADKALVVNSQIGDEYLLTLCLAHIAEVRCYLELEEFDTAAKRFQDGKEQLNTHIEKYVDFLLTDNPLMYLHPKLKRETDLSRLTRVYQWKDSSLTESAVFELMRDKMIVEKDFWRFIREGVREDMIQKLPESLTKMESMVETSQRFAAYELEVKAISKLGISFHEWLQLRPPESQDGRSLMYIVPAEPLELA